VHLSCVLFALLSGNVFLLMNCVATPYFRLFIFQAEIMIAEVEARGRGLGYEAISLMLRSFYVTSVRFVGFSSTVSYTGNIEECRGTSKGPH
jgi:hypothetical protein